MTTTFKDCRILLSKEMGDYWAGDSTTPATAAKTTLTDTALAVKANDWIDDDKEMYLLITDADVNEHEERHITSFASTSSTGVLTHVACTANNVAGVSYEVHRLFSASEKRRALIHAAKAMYPHGFIRIKDETHTSGNWLKDGSFEIWTASDNPTYWSNSTTVTTETTTALLFKHGARSCKLTTAGYIYQGISEWDDLKHLAGKTVTFTVQGYCATASTLRIAIYDGTTTTYSSYRTAESAWTEHNDPMTVTATIQDNPTAIEFRIYLVTANTAYVDDARVITGSLDSPRIYIGNLDLVQNKPHQVLIEPANYSKQEPWALVHEVKYDQTNEYMQLPSGITPDRRLRILGNRYLYFHDTSGVVGTDWDDDSIDLDDPQIEILIAQAMIYLCLQKAVPNDTSGEGKRWAETFAYWRGELRERISRFGMIAPSATVNWR